MQNLLLSNPDDRAGPVPRLRPGALPCGNGRSMLRPYEDEE